MVSALKLSSYIKRNAIDIVHSNSRTTQVIACLLSKFTGVTHIYTCHGFFKKRLSRRLFGCWGDRVVAISEEVKDHLLKDFSLEEDNIRVVYNGIDVSKTKIESEKSKAEIRKNFGLKEGPVVGIVARLSDVKGHIYLIEAMKTVLEKIPDAQLLIVGEGKTKEGLVNLSRRLGIRKNIFFVSRVSNTREALSVMDVFVLPSLKEGLGLSLMEAMLLGLAVVGSDIGGIRSLIKHGENGLLVEPADAPGLSHAIIELLQDQGKNKILGERARLFVSRNFSQERMLSETLSLYLECLNTKNS